MTWTAPNVTLSDGRVVPSDSVDWQRECEAMWLLGMEPGARNEMLLKIGKKRGPDALTELRKRCFELQPYYVLDRLADFMTRRAYLDDVEAQFGKEPRERLQEKIMAIHQKRQALASQQAASA